MKSPALALRKSLPMEPLWLSPHSSWTASTEAVRYFTPACVHTHVANAAHQGLHLMLGNSYFGTQFVPCPLWPSSCLAICTILLRTGPAGSRASEEGPV